MFNEAKTNFMENMRPLTSGKLTKSKNIRETVKHGGGSMIVW